MFNIKKYKYGDNLRFYGKSIPLKKTVLYGFKIIFGLGYSSLLKVLMFTKIKPTKKIKNLTNFEFNLLFKTIKAFKIKLDTKLRRRISLNIREKILLRTYEGLRHQLKLPVRGQRTRSNAKTQRYYKK